MAQVRRSVSGERTPIGLEPVTGAASRTIALLLLLVPLLLVALVAGARILLWSGPASALAAEGAAAADRLADAADEMDRALAPDGSGFRFTVVSRSTVYARPDGPRIEIPDPDEPTQVLRLADAWYVGASTAEGIVRGADFFLQMRDGPSEPDGEIDLAAMEPTLAALVRGGTTWRNDGRGWYPTDIPPGIGLDPLTVALLPDLLRGATDARSAEPLVVEGTTRAAVSARSTVEAAPGLMAIDAAPFTELTEPLVFAFG
jgi:hypothetical protein